MRRVIEVGASLLDACGAAEVVDRDRRMPTLREAQRQLLVEGVEAPHVGEHHDADPGGLLRGREETGEAVAVFRLEDEVVVRDSGPGDHRDGRQGVELEAHGRAGV